MHSHEAAETTGAEVPEMEVPETEVPEMEVSRLVAAKRTHSAHPGQPVGISRQLEQTARRTTFALPTNPFLTAHASATGSQGDIFEESLLFSASE